MYSSHLPHKSFLVTAKQNIWGKSNLSGNSPATSILLTAYTSMNIHVRSKSVKNQPLCALSQVGRVRGRSWKIERTRGVQYICIKCDCITGKLKGIPKGNIFCHKNTELLQTNLARLRIWLPTLNIRMPWIMCRGSDGAVTYCYCRYPIITNICELY